MENILAKILADKFRMSKYSNVKEWSTSCHVPLSIETASKVILRGVEPGIPTFITMAYHLGVPPKEISAACKAAGDTVFHKLIAPAEIDAEDRAVIELLAAIPAKKKKAALDMLKALGE